MRFFRKRQKSNVAKSAEAFVRNRGNLRQLTATIKTNQELSVDYDELSKDIHLAVSVQLFDSLLDNCFSGNIKAHNPDLLYLECVCFVAYLTTIFDNQFSSDGACGGDLDLLMREGGHNAIDSVIDFFEKSKSAHFSHPQEIIDLYEYRSDFYFQFTAVRDSVVDLKTFICNLFSLNICAYGGYIQVSDLMDIDVDDIGLHVGLPLVFVDSAKLCAENAIDNLFETGKLVLDIRDRL